VRGWLRDLLDVRDAAAAVLAAAKRALASDATFAGPVAALLAPEATLADYMAGLYEWCEALADTFDDLAQSVRRGAPEWPLSRWRATNRTFARFDDLTQEIQASLQRLRSLHADDDAAFRALENRVEELFWAASWLHVSIARRVSSTNA
jgi:hypothetical protein